MIAKLRSALHCRRNRLPLFAILVALWAASGAPGDAAPLIEAAPAHAARAAETIQMGHVSVSVIGKGRPVILIPGLSSPRAVWDGVAPELAKRHMVYLVQVNGFGGDDPRANLEGAILDGVVAELHALIVERKLKGAALVGHSLGGTLGMMLARDHPGDVGKLLIVDSLPWVGAAFAPGKTPAAAEPIAAQMRDQMAALHGKPMPDAVAQAIGARDALKPESRAKVAGWSAAADMRVAGRTIYEDMLIDLRPQLPQIATPMTVIVPWSAERGGESVVELYKREYAGTPKVRFVPLAESGHFAMLDQPEAFAAALRAFLE